jgi:hypothetical protein
MTALLVLTATYTANVFWTSSTAWISIFSFDCANAWIYNIKFLSALIHFPLIMKIFIFFFQILVGQGIKLLGWNPEMKIFFVLFYFIRAISGITNFFFFARVVLGDPKTVPKMTPKKWYIYIYNRFRVLKTALKK